MSATNWGNNDPTRQYSEPAQVKSEPLNYFKLYLTIVGGIITAFVIMGIFTLIINAFMISAVLDAFSPKTVKARKPSQQISTGLQYDLQQLANQQRQTNQNQLVSAPTVQKSVQPAKQAQQKNAAKQTDIQTCTYWRQQYAKEQTTWNKNYVNTSCKRAFGAQWQRVN